MSRLLSIVPTETETTSIVLNGPIEGHLIIFHQTKVKFYQIILSTATTEDSTPFGPKRSLHSDRWRLR